ncbi:MAG: hypothetical protein K0A90_02825 [Methanosarcinaceae archaeon]|nr:hypothetical protein [Methanosarcinaceae archaeon]
MKTKNLMLLLIIVVIAVTGCIGEDDTPLTNNDFDQINLHKEVIYNDCVECHPNQVKAMKMESSGLHSVNACDFCHVQHGYIPACSDCHGLNHDDTITNCKQCHTESHAPRNINFSMEEGDYSCSVCHTEQANILDANPTKHTDMNCQNCHTKHGFIPKCINCHIAHDDTGIMDNCNECHKTGHIPTKINT